MEAITISREMGSLGFAVAEIIARELGYQLVNRQVINQAARQAGTPEAALASIDELGLLGFQPTSEDVGAYLQAVGLVMLKMAHEGKMVFVGRGGQAILKGLPGIFHLRIYAAENIRIERVAKACGISVEAARARVQVSDRARQNYLQKHYRIDWHDPDLYDLMINTSRINVTATAKIVLTAYQHFLAA